MNLQNIIEKIDLIDNNDNKYFEFTPDIEKGEFVLREWISFLNSKEINVLNNIENKLNFTVKLNIDTINYLKYKRYGFKLDDPVDTIEIKYLDTKIKRKEFGGYISPYNIIEDIYSQEGGAIENYVYRKNVINFHTHPPYDRFWPYCPPSHSDISSIINMSLKDNYIYTSLISTQEGIYVYHLNPNFFNAIKGKELGDIEEYFLNLKKLLGYSKEIKLKKKRPQQTFFNIDENDNIRKPLLFGGNEDRYKLLHYNNQYISIEQYLEILNLMGITTKLYSYDVEEISIPIEMVQEGNGRYIIDYKNYIN